MVRASFIELKNLIFLNEFNWNKLFAESDADPTQDCAIVFVHTVVRIAVSECRADRPHPLTETDTRGEGDIVESEITGGIA